MNPPPPWLNDLRVIRLLVYLVPVLFITLSFVSGFLYFTILRLRALRRREAVPSTIESETITRRPRYTIQGILDAAKAGSVEGVAHGVAPFFEELKKLLRLQGAVTQEDIQSLIEALVAGAARLQTAHDAARDDLVRNHSAIQNVLDGILDIVAKWRDTMLPSKPPNGDPAPPGGISPETVMSVNPKLSKPGSDT